MVRSNWTGPFAMCYTQHVKLTDKEVQILKWISHGLTDKQMARIEATSVTSLRRQITKIYITLLAYNRPHAVRRGFEEGLLGTED